MSTLLKQVRTFRNRLLVQRVWNFGSSGLFVAGICGCLLGFGELTMQAEVSPVLVLTAILMAFFISAVIAFITRPSIGETARQIDDQCGFSDRIQTACQFAQLKHNTPVRQLQLKDAEVFLTAVDPRKIVPIQRPWSWNWGIVSSFVALLLSSLPETPVQPFAEISAVHVSAERAASLEKDREALLELLIQKQSPKLEELRVALIERFKHLQETSATPEDTFADLSELDALLVDAQKQISNSTVGTIIQETGNALTLADSLHDAGQAMATGDLELAAAKLETSTLPDLRPQTLTAVREQLDEVRRSGDQQSREGRDEVTRARDSVSNLAESLSSGDKESFEEAARQLAAQCRAELDRQRLSELLQQQQNSLNEFRLEIDQQLRSSGRENGGGLTAGTERGGAEARNSASTVKPSRQFDLKGSDSGSGESEKDKQTTTGTDPGNATSKLNRDYREQYERHRYLNEAALKSESIPLGHRQTIRKYFELIRPADSESH